MSEKNTYKSMNNKVAGQKTKTMSWKVLHGCVELRATAELGDHSLWVSFHIHVIWSSDNIKILILAALIFLMSHHLFDWVMTCPAQSKWGTGQETRASNTPKDCKTKPELKMRESIEVKLIKLRGTQLQMNAKYVLYLLDVFTECCMSAIMPWMVYYSLSESLFWSHFFFLLFLFPTRLKCKAIWEWIGNQWYSRCIFLQDITGNLICHCRQKCNAM